MSARPWYVVTCDAPGCSARFTADHERATATRTAAKLAGWSHAVVAFDGLPTSGPRYGGPSPSIDLCPAHLDVPLAEALGPSLARKGSR